MHGDDYDYDFIGSVALPRRLEDGWVWVDYKKDGRELDTHRYM